MQSIEVLFQNDDFIVINKPADMNFHSENEPGVVVKTEQILGIKLYSVHRLDKATSGLLILATSPQSAALFTTLFETHRIEKYYLAISLRKPKKKQGWIKGDIIPARRGSYKFAPSSRNPAVTQFVSTALRPNERLFLLKPHTGKTHQIRVALKSIGAPIAGDTRYANAVDAAKEERAYLHAYALRFRFKEYTYQFTCKPTEGSRYGSAECSQWLNISAQPWDFFT